MHPLPLFVLLGVLAAAAPARSGSPQDPAAIAFPYEWVGNIDPVAFDEPSGVVYHPERGTLFVVGDDGNLCELTTSGELVKQQFIRTADYEGITVDPASGLLYVAVEGDERIVEFDPEDFSRRRHFSFERQFQGQTVLAAGGSGLEGITFVPDAAHPHGGTFYVTNQSLDLASADEVSGIFQVEAPLRGTAPGDTTAAIVAVIRPGIIDLAGIYYDAAHERLFAISDAANICLVLGLDGSVQHAYAFPGDNQEGIAFDDQGYVYIAQDSGGIIKLRWLGDQQDGKGGAHGQTE